MSRLTARGWSVAVLAVATLGLGWWWRYPGLVAIGAAFTLLVLASLVSVVRPTRLRAHRVVEPQLVPRFERCTATAEIVHSGGWFAETVEVTDPIGGEVVPVVTASLRRGQTSTAEYEVPTRRRGLLTLGPMRLRRLGIAGLAKRVDLAAGTSTVRVLPRLLPLRALPAGSRRWSAGSDERVEHGGTDLVGMREYLPGDDLRRLHWATSARRGALMVREDADPSHGHVTVLLDDRLASHDSPAEFEEAVDVAASIAGAVSAAGHPVRISSASGRVSVERPGSPGTGVGRPAPELLAALADASLAGPGSPPQWPQDLDVLAVVGGANSDPGELALRAGKAALAVALIVSSAADDTSVTMTGPVLVLRGSSAEELLRGWDEQLAGAAVPWH